MSIPTALRDQVRERAGFRCEYCGLHEDDDVSEHEMDHIISQQHGGEDNFANLALACHHCNLHKGPNIASIDPKTGGVATLFNPRTQHWNEHFERRGVMIIGLTPEGRCTVRCLAANDPKRLEIRSRAMS